MGVGMFHRPLLKAATFTDTLCPTCAVIRRYVLQLPTGLQCDPIQIAEVVQQEYILVGVAWLYLRVNVCKHCKVTTEGAKTDLLIADDSNK